MPVTAHLDALLSEATRREASHLHLVPDQVPRVRTRAGLERVGEAPLAAADLSAMASALFGERRLERQALEGAARHSFRVGERTLARASLATTGGRHSLAIALRDVTVPAWDELGLPPEVEPLLDASHGLLIVAGPHASGKTTTLYGLTERICARKALHVCTVEDAPAYVLEPGAALVQQREVGTDVPDVARGIAVALEQDPDVLMIQDLLDLESLGAAVHAAETGHLVLVQVHADDADDALERIVEAAPPSLHAALRRSLSECLVGVVGQRLLPRATGHGRVAVHEVLVPDAATRAALRDAGSVRGLAPGAGSVARAERIAALEAAGTITAEAAAAARAS